MATEKDLREFAKDKWILFQGINAKGLYLYSQGDDIFKVTQLGEDLYIGKNADFAIKLFNRKAL